MMQFPDTMNSLRALSKRVLSPEQYYRTLAGLEESFATVPARHQSAETHFVLGAVYFAMGRLISAERALHAARAIDSTNVRVEYNLGVLSYAGHRERAAEQHWQRTIDLDSAFVEAHRNLCYLYYSRKNFFWAAGYAHRAQKLGANIPQELLEEITRGESTDSKR